MVDTKQFWPLRVAVIAMVCLQAIPPHAQRQVSHWRGHPPQAGSLSRSHFWLGPCLHWFRGAEGLNVCLWPECTLYMAPLLCGKAFDLNILCQGVVPCTPAYYLYPTHVPPSLTPNP